MPVIHLSSIIYQKGLPHEFFFAEQPPNCLGKQADGITDNADGKESKNDDERIDALPQEIHAGERHEKRNNPGH